MAASGSSSSSSSFMTCELLMPCRRALARLLRTPPIKAAFRFRNLRRAAAKMSLRRRRRRPWRTFRSVRTVFWPLVAQPPRASVEPASASEAADTYRMAGLPTPSTDRVPAPCPSPETPAYVKMARVQAEGDGEACRSFESCLREMLVEERDVKDVQDVEELLRCWERLKSPVFVELVCRFYGELCKDLFSGQGEGSVSSPI